MKRPVLALLLTLLLTALLLTPAGHAGGKAKVYKTPEAVFKALKETSERGDWEGSIACLTDDSRDLVAGTMVLGLRMARGFAEAFAKDWQGFWTGAFP